MPADVAANYAEEGELMLPGLAPLHGRNAIRDFLQPMVESIEVESVEMSTTLLKTHGDTADQWGTYRQMAGEKGKAKQEYKGRYAALWQRDTDHQWRLLRLMMQPMP